MVKKKIDIENEALQLVQGNMAILRNSKVNVTNKVSFDVRQLIEQCRKNYWNVFNTPTDEQTGRDKIFIPLTEAAVDSVVKNIDLDTKDITVRADGPEYVDEAKLARHKVRDFLEDIFFGEDLDLAERQLAIDGTVVWKTYMQNGKPSKPILVDLMNFYIDPVASCIQDTPFVIERGILLKSELKAMDGWINTDEVTSNDALHRNDPQLTNDASAANKWVEVFEYWGLMPAYFISGKPSEDKLIEGHIVCSNGAVHLIEKNTNKDKNGKIIKPYEECWYIKVHGRWYGRGVAEKLIMLQFYLNTIVNIRITRSYLSQMGLFKIRRGSGITPQQLSRLAVNGAVEVQNMQDIEQFVMQEASAASYNDEANIRLWAERITSTFEMVTGEKLPSGTTATVGSIQATSAQSQFVMVKEGIGSFLERWLNRHILPNLKIKKDDVLSISGLDENELKEHITTIARNIVLKQSAQGKYKTYEQAMLDLNDIIDRLSQKKEIFIKMDKEIPLSNFHVKADITNEEVDKNVLVTNLIQALSFAPEYKDPIVKTVFDLLGLDMPSNLPTPAPMQQAMPDMNSQLAKPTTAQKSPVGIMQEANTY